MPVSVFIIFSRSFSYLADPCRFFSCFFTILFFRWYLNLLASDLVSDVCFLSIEVMYIDVVL